MDEGAWPGGGNSCPIPPRPPPSVYNNGPRDPGPLCLSRVIKEIRGTNAPCPAGPRPKGGMGGGVIPCPRLPSWSGAPSGNRRVCLPSAAGRSRGPCLGTAAPFARPAKPTPALENHNKSSYLTGGSDRNSASVPLSHPRFVLKRDPGMGA